MSKISVQGKEITVVTQKKEDYISLTDIAKHKNSEATGLVLSHWLSTRFTVEFMGVWEKIHNANFNVTEFSNIRNESGSNGFVLSAKQWIGKTNAIGIISKAGRYGGTYAHKDIAFEFASWISVEFKLYLIKEFQRLKEDENNRQKIQWNVSRTLAKVNYAIHTDAIKTNLIPANIENLEKSFVYANEADLLNIALFGKTAKEWREENSDLIGNIRDIATLEQLVVLSNLESFNAELIKQNIPAEERLKQLNKIAIGQIKVLIENKSLKQLREKI